MLELVAAPIAAALALFGYIVVADPQSVHLESISTPAALAADGYTAPVIEARLSDALRAAEVRARSYPSARRLEEDAQPTALRILSDAVGATAAVRATQKALGRIDYAAAGEVVRNGEQLELRLRVIDADGGRHAVVAAAPAGEVGRLIDDGALALLGVADPYARAAWQLKADHAAGQGFGETRALAAAAERAPRAADPRWAANLAGIAAFADNRTEEALAAFDRALALDPEFTPAVVNRGAVLAAAGRHRDAIEQYRTALTLYQGGAYGPAHAVAYAHWGVSLAALKQVDAARASFEYAVQSAPDYDDAYVKWAAAMRAAGRDEDAAQALNRRADPAAKPSLAPEYLAGPIGPDAYGLVVKGLATPG